MPEDNDKRLRAGIEHLRKIHEALIDLEVQLEMELVNCPADSGFEEAQEAIEIHWKSFNRLFED